MNKIFIGYDTREKAAYDVAKKSILNFNSDYQIIPLVQTELRESGVYWRKTDLLASTEFTITRFLTPHLSNYKGWSIFIDCDVLLLTDIKELFELADSKYAVQVVKHDYKPSNKIKMDGKLQSVYPKKNWSSVILFNNEHPSNKKLNLNFINESAPSVLHRFEWLSENEIGEIPNEWNWLVGWYKETLENKPKLLHFTEGGPWFEEYKDCEYADLWNAIYNTIGYYK